MGGRRFGGHPARERLVILKDASYNSILKAVSAVIAISLSFSLSFFFFPPKEAFLEATFFLNKVKHRVWCWEIRFFPSLVKWPGTSSIEVSLFSWCVPAVTGDHSRVHPVTFLSSGPLSCLQTRTC